ncbi:ankyrin repeat family protein [Tanacetum coccineum]|uniref:Ankyrin repeat family protein n=1 Tax=Tanacetum coccineum TaxID=301880 RepID=A0ABQ4XD02_9ASTR
MGGRVLICVAGQLDDGKGLSQIVVNIKNVNKRGALRFAAREGQLEVCNYLTYRVMNSGDNAGRLNNGGADVVVIWAYTNHVECPPKERHIRKVDDAALISIDSKGTNVRARQGAQVHLEDGTLAAKSEGVEFKVKDGHFCPALSVAVKNSEARREGCSYSQTRMQVLLHHRYQISTDFDKVLARQKPTVSKSDLEVHDKFMREFGEG